MGEVEGPGHAEPRRSWAVGGQNCSPAEKGRRELPVRKRERGNVRGSAWDAEPQCPCPKTAGAPPPPGLVVRAKGQGEAGSGCAAWGLPAPPRPGQPGARLSSRVSLRATRGRCGPPAARGAAWSRLGAEGRPRGGRREERGTSASRSLTGRCWRPRWKRRESAARGPHSPAPSAPRGPDHGRQVGG